MFKDYKELKMKTKDYWILDKNIGLERRPTSPNAKLPDDLSEKEKREILAAYFLMSVINDYKKGMDYKLSKDQPSDEEILKELQEKFIKEAMSNKEKDISGMKLVAGNAMDILMAKLAGKNDIDEANAYLQYALADSGKRATNIQRGVKGEQTYTISYDIEDLEKNKDFEDEIKEPNNNEENEMEKDNKEKEGERDMDNTKENTMATEEKRKELDKLREERRKIGKAVMEANKTGNSSEYAILRTESVRLDNEIKKMEDELKEQESTITPEEAEIKSLEEQLAKKRELQQRAKENGAYEQEAQLESEANEIVRAIRELKDKTKEPENTITPEEAEIKSLEEQLAKKRELQQRAKENGAYEQEAQLESEANEIVRVIRELKDKSKEQENPTTDEMAKLQEKLKLLKEEENEYIGAYYIPKELTDEIKQIEEEISKLKDNLIEKETIEEDKTTIEKGTGTVEESTITVEEEEPTLEHVDNSSIGEGGFRAPSSIDNSDGFRAPGSIYDSDNPRSSNFGLDDDTSLGSRTDLGRDIPLSGNNIFKRIPVTEDIIIPVDNTQTIENPTQPEPTQTQTSDEINKINDEIKKLEESIDKIMESDAINDEDKKRLIIEVRKQISEKHKERAEAIENNEQDRQDPIQGSGEGRPGRPDAPHENNLPAQDDGFIVYNYIINECEDRPKMNKWQNFEGHAVTKAVQKAAPAVALLGLSGPLGWIGAGIAGIGTLAATQLVPKAITAMSKRKDTVNKFEEIMENLPEERLDLLLDYFDNQSTIINLMPNDVFLEALQKVAKNKLDEVQENADAEVKLIDEQSEQLAEKISTIDSKLQDPSLSDDEKDNLNKQKEALDKRLYKLDTDRRHKLEDESKKYGNIYNNIKIGRKAKSWQTRGNVKGKADGMFTTKNRNVEKQGEAIATMAEHKENQLEAEANKEGLKAYESRKLKNKAFVENDKYFENPKSMVRKVSHRVESRWDAIASSVVIGIATVKTILNQLELQKGANQINQVINNVKNAKVNANEVADAEKWFGISQNNMQEVGAGREAGAFAGSLYDSLDQQGQTNLANFVNNINTSVGNKGSIGMGKMLEIYADVVDSTIPVEQKFATLKALGCPTDHSLINKLLQGDTGGQYGKALANSLRGAGNLINNVSNIKPVKAIADFVSPVVAGAQGIWNSFFHPGRNSEDKKLTKENKQTQKEADQQEKDEH